MTIVRVSLLAGEAEAAELAARLEAAFEDRDVPVGREEIDEARRLWRVDALFSGIAPEAAEAEMRSALGSKQVSEKCPTLFGQKPASEQNPKQAQRGEAGANLLSDSHDLTVEVLDEATDWIRHSQEILKPIAAGRFFVHGSHDRLRARSRAHAIEIDAALAFGTGHHATTRACLVALDRLLATWRPKRVLDLGTGTGVLAIAIAKSTRRPVLASDIDPVAAATARANAALNGVGPLVTVVAAPGVAHPKIREATSFDLVVANILARPLIDLAGPVAALSAPRAVAILSGLRTGDERAVLAAWAARGFRLRDRIAEGGWLALVLARQPQPNRQSARLGDFGVACRDRVILAATGIGAIGLSGARPRDIQPDGTGGEA